ncbi:hypothetical protein CW304_01120 [Bacillus sp. UFRGS-B20]|nr:hypothetical protein CW304_01120 [Bacillus sp. UFRGS-B20]
MIYFNSPSVQQSINTNYYKQHTCCFDQDFGVSRIPLFVPPLPCKNASYIPFSTNFMVQHLIQFWPTTLV